MRPASQPWHSAHQSNDGADREFRHREAYVSD